MSLKESVLHSLAALADPARRDEYFDLYAPNIVLHGYDGVGPGLDSVKAFYQAMFVAFPDLLVTAHDFVEQGDQIAVRFELTGTHQGPYLGIPATGRPIQLAGITILRFAEGQCVERWSMLNGLTLLTQLGAFPPPA